MPLTLRRGFLLFAGGAILLYAIGVFLYIQWVPDLGLKTGFNRTQLWSEPAHFDGPDFTPGDTVATIGPVEVRRWRDLLNAPSAINRQIAQTSEPPSWAKIRAWRGDAWVDAPWSAREFDDHATWIRLGFRRDDGTTYDAWARLGSLPVRELIPSILWLLLKATLLLVGAWVWWKKPGDAAAERFYVMCLVTVGAYLGGYHWTHLAVQPALLLVFIVCAVMLPVVSLHFYLLFPRPKVWVTNHPRGALALIYGVPTLFLAAILALYAWGRWGTATEGALENATEWLRSVVNVYFGVATLWYLGSVVSLIHSAIAVQDPMERNQVRSILFGAILATAPIGYALYMATFDSAAFSAGGATWPMFAASAILTVAYAVSITRYRLMELEKLLSSSMDYFVASFLAAALYYAVVFVGTLLFNRYVAGPKLTEALAVSATALLLLLGLDQARWKVRRFLDRRFVKQKSQLDLTLQRMGSAIEQLADPLVLAQKFLQATTELLGARQGAVFLVRAEEPSAYRLGACIGAAPPLAEIGARTPLVEALARGVAVHASPRPYPPTSPDQRQLSQLGGELAYPVLQDDRMLAFVVLGPRDLPYRDEDVDMLRGFAPIAALALENAATHRSIELLNRELGEKVQKISEQQRRILALQSQLRQRTERPAPAAPAPIDEAKPAEPPTPFPVGIVGSSRRMADLANLVRKVAGTDAAVLIRGESGTGKELLAQAVHESSGRSVKPFVRVHCAALSAGLLESELFGHVKGAFTGAHKDKVGRFEAANGGTLFLDEIGDVSLDVQTKLLRVLQERTFERVGSSESIRVDVRVVTATHQNLESLIRQGRFREDLFYRLNVFPLFVPPLRDRAEDIVELANHFVKRFAVRCKKDLAGIDDDAMTILRAYSWPGNIRQLENAIERAVVVADGPTITPHELPPEMFSLSPAPTADEPFAADADDALLAAPRPLSPWRRDRLRAEREELVQALASAGGNKSEAAKALGVARSTFLSRLKKFGLA